MTPDPLRADLETLVLRLARDESLLVEFGQRALAERDAERQRADSAEKALQRALNRVDELERKMVLMTASLHLDPL